MKTGFSVSLPAVYSSPLKIEDHRGATFPNLSGCLSLPFQVVLYNTLTLLLQVFFENPLINLKPFLLITHLFYPSGKLEIYHL